MYFLGQIFNFSIFNVFSFFQFFSVIFSFVLKIPIFSLISLFSRFLTIFIFKPVITHFVIFYDHFWPIRKRGGKVGDPFLGHFWAVWCRFSWIRTRPYFWRGKKPRFLPVFLVVFGQFFSLLAWILVPNFSLFFRHFSVFGCDPKMAIFWPFLGHFWVIFWSCFHYVRILYDFNITYFLGQLV